jgi:heat shock protein HslJ
MEYLRMKRLLLGLLVLMFALAACGNAAPGLTGVTWKLVSYGPPDQLTAAAPNVETSLVFGEDGKVSGSMGCNQFGGSYETKGDQISFGPLAATLMACPEPAMSQETAVLAILSGTVTYKLDGNSLTLTGQDGSLANFSATK